MDDLAYEIIYSSRKTTELRFKNENLLLIKVPNKTSKKRIADILLDNQAWIVKTRQKIMSRPKPLPTPQLVDGENVLLLGEKWTLRVAPGTKAFIRMEAPKTLIISKAAAETGTEALKAFYKEKTREWTTAFAEKYAQQWKLNYSGIRITSAQTRWGSCGPRNSLNLSWRLAMVPMHAIEYVVAHELAHTVHHNHSKDFWDFLAKMMPNYKTSRAWLKKNGQILPVF